MITAEIKAKQVPFHKTDLILTGIFICIHFLLQQNAMIWTVYNLYNLGLSVYFIVKVIRQLTQNFNGLFIASNWFLSVCIGMAIVHSYVDYNQGLKLITLFLGLINAFFIYKYSRMDQGKALGSIC